MTEKFIVNLIGTATGFVDGKPVTIELVIDGSIGLDPDEMPAEHYRVVAQPRLAAPFDFEGSHSLHQNFDIQGSTGAGVGNLIRHAIADGAAAVRQDS